MSFFSNPFSSKRRRETQELEELELGTPGESAPETPPTDSGFGRQPRQHPSPSSSSDSPSSLLSSNASQQETTIKVSARAQYFESLIRSKAPENDASSNTADLIPSLKKSPRQHNNGCAELFGGLTAAAAADAFQNLRLELTRVERERLATVEALRRKTQEAENLQNIVRELTESRAAALSAKQNLAEQYVDLSRAHERVIRIAHLSREVSKENLELTKNARSIAAEMSKGAAEAKREAEMAVKAENKASQENAVLRQKVNVLEQIAACGGGLYTHFSGGERGCRPEFTLPIETY
jgi:hypothetical protein